MHNANPYTQAIFLCAWFSSCLRRCAGLGLDQRARPKGKFASTCRGGGSTDNEARAPLGTCRAQGGYGGGRGRRESSEQIPCITCVEGTDKKHEVLTRILVLFFLLIVGRQGVVLFSIVGRLLGNTHVFRRVFGRVAGGQRAVIWFCVT